MTQTSAEKHHERWIKEFCRKLHRVPSSLMEKEMRERHLYSAYKEPFIDAYWIGYKEAIRKAVDELVKITDEGYGRGGTLRRKGIGVETIWLLSLSSTAVQVSTQNAAFDTTTSSVVLAKCGVLSGSVPVAENKRRDGAYEFLHRESLHIIIPHLLVTLH